MKRETTPFADCIEEMLAKRRAEAETRVKVAVRVDSIVRVLRIRFGEPTAALTAKIAAEHDYERLGLWLDLACRAPSLADFERQLPEAR